MSKKEEVRARIVPVVAWELQIQYTHGEWGPAGKTETVLFSAITQAHDMFPTDEYDLDLTLGNEQVQVPAPLTQEGALAAIGHQKYDEPITRTFKRKE